MMPYFGPDDKNLPDNVKERPKSIRAQWVRIWNSAYDYAKSKGMDDPEAYAFGVANGQLKKGARMSEDGHGETVNFDKDDLPEIEVFRAGDYGLKGIYRVEDVAAMVDDYCPEYHEAPVTTDHLQEGPAFGWVKSLRAQGGRLFAKFHRLTDEFKAKLRSGEYRKRSIELYRVFAATGRPYVRAVTFLGAASPEVKGMEDFCFSEMDEVSGEHVAVDFHEENHDSEKQNQPKEDTQMAETIQDTKAYLELADKFGVTRQELEAVKADLAAKDDEIKTLREQLDGAKHSEAKAVAQVKINEAIAGVDLPEPAKKRLRERFKDAESTEGLEDAVKEERAYVEQLSDAGKVKGMGEGSSQETKKRLQEAETALYGEDK